MHQEAVPTPTQSTSGALARRSVAYPVSAVSWGECPSSVVPRSAQSRGTAGGEHFARQGSNHIVVQRDDIVEPAAGPWQGATGNQG